MTPVRPDAPKRDKKGRKGKGALRIGIDVGGTKIEAIGLDERGEALARLRLPTPRGDYS